MEILFIYGGLRDDLSMLDGGEYNNRVIHMQCAEFQFHRNKNLGFKWWEMRC